MLRSARITTGFLRSRVFRDRRRSSRPTAFPFRYSLPLRAISITSVFSVSVLFFAARGNSTGMLPVAMNVEVVSTIVSMTSMTSTNGITFM